MNKGLMRGDIIIGIEKWEGIRKKPVLCVKKGNTAYKVASFNNDETAEWFIEIAEKFFEGFVKKETEK